MFVYKCIVHILNAFCFYICSCVFKENKRGPRSVPTKYTIMTNNPFVNEFYLCKLFFITWKK